MHIRQTVREILRSDSGEEIRQKTRRVNLDRITTISSRKLILPTAYRTGTPNYTDFREIPTAQEQPNALIQITIFYQGHEHLYGDREKILPQLIEKPILAVDARQVGWSYENKNSGNHVTAWKLTTTDDIKTYRWTCEQLQVQARKRWMHYQAIVPVTNAYHYLHPNTKLEIPNQLIDEGIYVLPVTGKEEKSSFYIAKDEDMPTISIFENDRPGTEVDLLHCFGNGTKTIENERYSIDVIAEEKYEIQNNGTTPILIEHPVSKHQF